MSMVTAMPRRSQQTAAPLIPSSPTISKLRTVAAGCLACDLWKLGTQTVFGEGGSKPRVMFVGEQPGDQEDIQGRPFVGPAGKILDKALAAISQRFSIKT
jgi:uracil-DNA glycosylase